ncbi:centrosomal protein of 128 kDa-like [Watersipora subatra]|uniref:centrosomal protein of 128 kDa-like n=1 Tax=Watersipora subatra TaxID=2589382 RepID=UPI00355B2430
MEQENRRLVSKLEVATNEIDELKQMLHARKQSIKAQGNLEKEHLLAENQQLSGQLRDSLQDLESFKKECDISVRMSNEEKDSLLSDLNIAQKDLSKTKALLAKLEQNCALLQEEKERMIEDIDLSSAAERTEITALREKNKKLENKNAEMLAEFQTTQQQLLDREKICKQQNVQLKKELNEKQEELEELVTACEDLKQRMVDQEAERKQSKDKLEKEFTKKQTELEGLMKGNKKDFEEEMLENQRLKSKLQEARDEIESIRLSLNRRHVSATTQAKFAVDERSTSIDSNLHRIASAGTQAAATCENCNLLNLEKDDLHSKLQNCRDELNSCLSATAEAHDSLNSLKLENDRMVQELSQKRQELEHIRESFRSAEQQASQSAFSSETLPLQKAISLPNRTASKGSKPELNVPRHSSNLLPTNTQFHHEVE